ncbi:MAG TPA: hypothetical protein VK074_03210 [Fodinibius sp.]|nr:hypothetical protein [Fodinibius sp.]
MDQYDEALFEKKVCGKSYSYRNLLMGLLQHDICHLGQIEFINKSLSQKKNPSKGILKYSFRVFPFESLAQQK